MSEARRDTLYRLLQEAHTSLGLSFGFELWDGSIVPSGADPKELRLVIKDEGVIASLIRKPSLDTLIQLYASGRLDLANGHFLDLATKRPQGKPKTLLKSLSKLKLLKLAASFWFAPKDAPRARVDLVEDRTAYEGDARVNKRNIAYHYDVGNEFYQLFLDPDMVYSCGYFQTWHEDLAKAQTDKLDMICRKLRLKAGERFLDIGCGWGALIIHAAKHYGVTATGVTLSEEQAALARERVMQAGLSDTITISLQDYASLEGTFDKIASIGMFEHVGLANHDRYFSAVHRLLRPRGLYLHHAIARPAKRSDKHFKKGSAEYKALTRYIFPGGELDHVGLSITNLERHKFEIHDVEGWREHYGRTCRLWFERLHARQAEAAKLVGSEKTRLWLLYLAGCALAFERGSVGIFQTLASRRTKGASGLPASRADLYE